MIKYFYIESYGCQMNIYDNELIITILTNNNFIYVDNIYKADLILINTCAIREKAETKIYNRLLFFNSIKKKKVLGLIGCMANRIDYKYYFKKNMLNFIIGPDQYRQLPNIIKSLNDNRYSYNVILSNDENYNDIIPNKLYSNNKVSSFVTISRGCDNMCTFCVVPFTRGREKNKSPIRILNECKRLYDLGYKEVILLGQNVNSYLWNKKSFIKKNIINKKKSINFTNLLEMIAKSLPNIRIRFSTSNPQDMSIEVIKIIKKYNNICKSIHLPFQSGSNRILKLMKRKYTRLEYINLVEKIKNIIPDCSLSYDIITGFCSETNKDHKDTLNLMKYIKFDFGYMFCYSHRKGTYAYKILKDNVPIKIKKYRLKEIIRLQRKHSYYRLKKNINSIQEVLIEGISKKNKNYWYGRNSQNSIIVFPKTNENIGELVNVKIINNTSATLIGDNVENK
ncbi:tRNA (N6-isopentenyl adenosine(37)-C2)-methylthiotransferase MiaB [Candidatus Shikimatogenerans bostrichidophilus]|uniref:tRNA (N6-isopentenyl adenosine(37)-C2)-methylthiotransferase MiaB n=1 Tax=Candidatus Shikimatogenerans bostrichidophilus TaxID=2943807 RepID=UPI002967433D